MMLRVAVSISFTSLRRPRRVPQHRIAGGSAWAELGISDGRAGNGRVLQGPAAFIELNTIIESTSQIQEAVERLSRPGR